MFPSRPCGLRASRSSCANIRSGPAPKAPTSSASIRRPTQVLAQAIEATKSLDQKRLAQHLHEATFETLVGTVKFGPTGEQAVPRILFVQYQGIVGNDLDQFNDPGRQVIVSPPAFVSGKFLYPYADLRR